MNNSVLELWVVKKVEVVVLMVVVEMATVVVVRVVVERERVAAVKEMVVMVVENMGMVAVD